MNPIIRILIATDFFLFAGFGLTAPIFAIFVERNIVGGSIATAGLSQTVYMVVKSVLQLFIGRFNDRDHGELREFWTALAGYGVLVVVPFLYAIVETIGELYAVQVLFGVGAALAYPGFMTIFTKFADPQREGIEWSLYSTMVFLGMAVTAAVGGWFVERIGFSTVFRIVGGIAAIAFLAFASLARNYAEFRRDHRPPHRHLRDVLPVK